MKNKITISTSNNFIHFFLNCNAGKAYLFSEKFTKGVYTYFRNGRSESELRSYRDFNRNKRRDHTVAKCLNKSYRRVALDELNAA